MSKFKDFKKLLLTEDKSLYVDDSIEIVYITNNETVIVIQEKINSDKEGEELANEILKKLTWQSLLIAGAEGIASYAAVSIIKNVLGLNINYEKLFSNAIKEIAAIIRQEINNSFVTEYLADCASIRSELLTYENTKDIEILKSIRPRASQLARRLQSFYNDSDPGNLAYAGGFTTAASLHMITIKALSEKDKNYKKTLKRLTEEYSDLLTDIYRRFRQHAEKNVSKCGCTPVRRRSGGGRRDTDPTNLKDIETDESSNKDLLGYNCAFRFDHGADRRYFGYADHDNSRRECERVREIYYNDRIRRDREIVNGLKLTAKRWLKYEFKIE